MKDEIRVVARMDKGRKIRLYHLLLDEGKTFSAWLREQADAYINAGEAKKAKGTAKKLAAISLLILLAGCGYDDGNGTDNCKWVRFVPEQGDSYYQYVCDDRSDLVRNESDRAIPKHIQ